VALSFFQKVRVIIRVWSRRREESAASRRRAFLEKEISWGETNAPPTARTTSRSSRFDIEGLQIAWLDDSGQIAYYLDRDSGDVIESPPGSEGPSLVESESRYIRVPSRDADSDAIDRRAFIDTLESPVPAELRNAAATPSTFREAIARDRKIERTWYNFKNERALAAIDEWLRTSIDNEPESVADTSTDHH